MIKCFHESAFEVDGRKLEGILDVYFLPQRPLAAYVLYILIPNEKEKTTKSQNSMFVFHSL